MAPISAPPAQGTSARPSWRSIVAGATAADLAHPESWPVALAGFLARGGIVAFVLPIVVLPNPAGVANVIGPALTSFVFGSVSPLFVVIVVLAIVAFVVAFVLGMVAGAWADVVLIEAGAADEELVASPRPVHSRRGLVGRAFAVRLLAHVPIGIVLAWSAVRIYQAAYNELVTPFEVVSPYAVRVLSAVPDAIAAVVVAWLLGEVAGGFAVRHVVLGGASIPAALRDGWLDVVRRPVASVATLIVTDAVVALAIVPAAVAAGLAWNVVRFLVLDDDATVLVSLAVVALVAVWFGGLFLAGVAGAWRSLAWTAEWLRRRPSAVADAEADTDPDAAPQGGTIGLLDTGQPGDWSSPGTSGTL